MRGQIFGLDAIMAALLLASALSIVETALYSSNNVISKDLMYRRLEITAYHAIDVLLQGDGAWACTVSGVRIPGCVKEVSGSQKDSFFINNVHCRLEGDDSIANLMGCDESPGSALVKVVIPFKACVTASTPDNCVEKDLTLTIWSG